MTVYKSQELVDEEQAIVEDALNSLVDEGGEIMGRELNTSDLEVKNKIKELQLFVNSKLKAGELSDGNMGQRLIDDVQILHHIWTKDKNGI